MLKGMHLPPNIITCLYGYKKLAKLHSCHKCNVIKVCLD